MRRPQLQTRNKKLSKMTTNLSLYTVPIAWLVALAPRAYSLSTYNQYSAYTKEAAGRTSLRTPRAFAGIAKDDASIPALYRERIVRAENASLNGLENLGFFAAAVAAGNAAGLNVALLNRSSVAYVLSRILYNVVFIRNDTPVSFLCARESSLLGP